MHELDNVQQLLLNISRAAGTGKSFFLNTVTQFAREELGRDGFVQAAAPFDTAAYFINGMTLHSVLCLPVGTSKYLPMPGETLKCRRDTFSNVGVLFINHK